MPPLLIHCYTDAGNKDVVGEWYGKQDESIQADLLGIIDQLEGNARARTNPEIFKELEKHSSSKSCMGFYEIRVIKDGHHCRIVGLLNGNVFTMLDAFSKDEGNRYKPHCDRAVERKAELNSGRAGTRECDFSPLDAD